MDSLKEVVSSSGRLDNKALKELLVKLCDLVGKQEEEIRILKSRVDELTEDSDHKEEMNVMRMIRRMDGFNESLSEARLEIGKISSEVSEFKSSLVDFNHKYYDVAVENQNIRASAKAKSGFFQQSIKNLESQMSDMWVIMSQVCDSQHHAVSNTVESIEQVQSILTMAINRALPQFISVSDVLLELQSTRELIADKRMQHITEREKFDKLPDDGNVSSSVSQLEVPKGGESGGYRELERNLVELSIEQLRVSVKEIKTKVKAMAESFDELKESVAKEISSKVDSELMNRLFNKFQSTVSRLHQRLDLLDQAHIVSTASSRQIKRPVTQQRVVKEQLRVNKGLLASSAMKF